MNHRCSALTAFRTQLGVALIASWLLTKYWWTARRGAPSARLAALLPTQTSGAIPLWLPSSRIVAIVSRVAAFHPLRPACLPQALTACHLLLSGGREASVRLGVERGQRQLGAHAWVHAPDLPDERHAGFIPLGDLRSRTF